jgi:hypothetical protein
MTEVTDFLTFASLSSLIQRTGPLALSVSAAALGLALTVKTSPANPAHSM